MDLVSRLKKVIQELGLKNDEFAEKCGVSKPQIYKYLSGIQEPGTKFYRNLKTSFPTIDIGWLITGMGKMIQSSYSNYPNGELCNSEPHLKAQNEILKRFDDHDAVLEINQNLLYLEQKSKASFDKARYMILGLKEGASVAAEEANLQKVGKKKKDTLMPLKKERMKKAAG